MEVLIKIVVALIGAGGTVLAAYIQRSRRESTYADAPVVGTPSAPVSPDTNELEVLFVFPGSRELADVNKGWKQITYGSIEMALDGRPLGTGDGCRGFQVEASGHVGLHDLVFQWDVTTETDTSEAARRLNEASAAIGGRTDYEGGYRSKTETEHRVLELVFAARGRCVVRLGFSGGKFYIKSVEPRRAVFTPVSIGTIVGLGLAGLAIAAISIGLIFIR